MTHPQGTALSIRVPSESLPSEASDTVRHPDAEGPISGLTRPAWVIVSTIELPGFRLRWTREDTPWARPVHELALDVDGQEPQLFRTTSEHVAATAQDGVIRRWKAGGR
jgi:hypothetical protein